LSLKLMLNNEAREAVAKCSRGAPRNGRILGRRPHPGASRRIPD